MPLARPVASLAVNPFRERLNECHLRTGRVLHNWNFRIRVVAEHALIVHGTYRTRIIRLIVSQTHLPVTSFLRIPAQKAGFGTSFAVSSGDMFEHYFPSR